MNTGDDELPKGWVKPQRSLTLAELHTLIAEKKAELTLLEKQARELESHARLQALAQARNIMRAHALTVADVTAV
jgi:hypothetical protein